MRQSIETKYLQATNHRPARIKATASSGLSLAASYQHYNNTAEHIRVMRLLCDKLGWTGRWHIGGTKTGFVFVCEDEPVINLGE